MNIKDGLTTGPIQEVDPAADASREGRALGHALSHADDYDTKAGIKNALLGNDPNLTTDVRFGLATVADVDRHGHTAAERAALIREHEQWVNSPEGQQLAAEAAERRVAADEEALELATYRRGEAINALTYADDEHEQAWIWGHLDPVGRAEAIEQLYIEPDEQALLDETFRLDLEEARRQETTQQQFERAVQNASARAEAFEILATERGLDPNSPQAHQWLNELAAVAEDAGVNLQHTDGESFAAALRGAEATVKGVVTSEQDRAFKQALFDTDDTSIASGLRVLGTNGFQPVIERPTIAAKPVDTARIMRAMDGRVSETAEEVRASVADEGQLAYEYKRVQEVGGELFARAEKTARQVFGSGIR